MSERPLSKNCKEMIDAFKELGLEDSLSINNMGINEGCVIDVKHKHLAKYAEAKRYLMQTSSSIYVNEKGDPSAEVMVPHCTSKASESFLVTEGIELCWPGCKISHTHIHSGLVPTTHIHVECRAERFANPPHCVRKFPQLIAKLEEFIKKTCI